MNTHHAHPKKIGIFGGSFDPPHIGHLQVAHAAIRHLHLDRLYFVPARISPLKRNNHSTSATVRLALVKLAIGNTGGIRISNYEIKRNTISYTITTLKYFRKQFPKDSLYLIIGTDSASTFDAWKDPKEILHIASLVVYRRRGHTITSALLRTCAELTILKEPMIDISSSLIRRYLKEGKSVKSLIPSNVERYILKNDLYR
jgi:nicotinate-nucleotide adenylyltransferase